MGTLCENCLNAFMDDIAVHAGLVLGTGVTHPLNAVMPKAAVMQTKHFTPNDPALSYSSFPANLQVSAS